MQAKNRKFNVAGVTFYKNHVEEGDLVFFELEPNNPHDINAIKVLNEGGHTLGHVPKDNAREIQGFVKGKYPYYCARVVSTWQPDSKDFVVPEIYAHFANKPNELPYASQEWKDGLYGLSRKPTAEEIANNRAIFLFLTIGCIILWGVLFHFTNGYIVPSVISGAIFWLGIKWLTRDNQ